MYSTRFSESGQMSQKPLQSPFGILIEKARRARVKTHISELQFSTLSQEVNAASIPSMPAPLQSMYFRIRSLNMPVFRWDPYYVKSLTRFSDQGLIPPLSAAQLEAADVLEKTCVRESLHMILEIGDIQFLSNEHVLHARTAYTDHKPPAPRRHLMRLWLATPETEDGWKLPFHDSQERKRGGVQVNNTPPVAPLDAE